MNKITKQNQKAEKIFGRSGMKSNAMIKEVGEELWELGCRKCWQGEFCFYCLKLKNERWDIGHDFDTLLQQKMGSGEKGYYFEED